MEAGVLPTLPVLVQLALHHGGSACVLRGGGVVSVKRFKTIALYYCQISRQGKK